MKRDALIQQLTQADARIAREERGIAEQRVLIRALRSNGQDTRGAEAVIATMREALFIYQQDRERILKALRECR